MPVEFRDSDGAPCCAGAAGRLGDPTSNDLLAVNQFTVVGSRERRPDVVLFVNGLPLVLMELKRPGEQNATLRGAFNQIQTYLNADSRLFTWNEVTVISDGAQARVGTLTAAWSTSRRGKRSTAMTWCR